MMKKTGIHILGLLLIVVAVAAVFWAVKNLNGHDDKNVNQNTAVPTNPIAKSKACQIFSAADAKNLLGGNIKGGQSSVSSTSPDLSVSTCAYTQSTDSGVSVSDRKSASLLARIPKTDKGIISNNNEFGPLKPTTVEDAAGYGDYAYWDAEHGQLNILKNNNWYILSYGPAAPASRSLQLTEQFADLLIDKL